MAFLNSSDYHRLRNPVHESEPEPPAPDPAKILEQKMAELSEAHRREQEGRAKIQKLLEENNRSQEILRQQLLQRTAQPAAEQPKSTGDSWLDLMNLSSSPTQSTEDPMASSQSGGEAMVPMSAIDRILEEKLAARERAAREVAAQQQQQVEQLRNRFKNEHAHISEDPELAEFASSTMNEIQQINPNLPYEQVYNMAIEKTQKVAQTFRQPHQKGQSRMQQAAQAQPNAYMTPNYGNQGTTQKKPSDPFAGAVETISPEDRMAVRRQEINEARQAHLARFRR